MGAVTKFEGPESSAQNEPRNEHHWHPDTVPDSVMLAGCLTLALLAHVSGADSAVLSSTLSTAHDTLIGIKEVVFGHNTNP